MPHIVFAESRFLSLLRLCELFPRTAVWFILGNCVIILAAGLVLADMHFHRFHNTLLTTFLPLQCPIPRLCCFVLCIHEAPAKHVVPFFSCANATRL